MDTVKSVMTPNPICCSPNDHLEKVAKLMAEHQCGIIPVIDVDLKPIGVITDRDICLRAVALGRNPLSIRALDIMSSPCITTHVEMELEQACSIMELNSIRRIIVVDNNNKCIGLVSLTDIVRSGEQGLAFDILSGQSEPKDLSFGI